MPRQKKPKGKRAEYRVTGYLPEALHLEFETLLKDCEQSERNVVRGAVRFLLPFAKRYGLNSHCLPNIPSEELARRVLAEYEQIGGHKVGPGSRRGP